MEPIVNNEFNNIELIINNKTDYSTGNKAYMTWYNMLERCYSGRYPSYVECEVCDEWKSYYNFKDWYDKNYYIVDSERMELDKDILGEGKLYSPDTCVFVPKRINLFFAHKSENEGIQEFNKRFKSCYWDSKQKKNIYSCLFSTFDQASEVYKEAKQRQLELILEEYIDKLPDKVYNALANYQF